MTRDSPITSGGLPSTSVVAGKTRVETGRTGKNTV